MKPCHFRLKGGIILAILLLSAYTTMAIGAADGPLVMPSKIELGESFLTMSVGGRNVSLLLDAGAPLSEISKAAASQSKVGEAIVATTPDVSSKLIVVDSQKAAKDGDHSDGVLGAPFFHQFVVGFDMLEPTKHIYLWPNGTGDVQLRSWVEEGTGNSVGVIPITVTDKGCSVEAFLGPSAVECEFHTAGNTSLLRTQDVPKGWWPLAPNKDRAIGALVQAYVSTTIKVGLINLRWRPFYAADKAKHSKIASVLFGSPRLVVDFASQVVYVRAPSSAGDDWAASLSNWLNGLVYMKDGDLFVRITGGDLASAKPSDPDVLLPVLAVDNIQVKDLKDAYKDPGLLIKAFDELLHFREHGGVMTVLYEGEPGDVKFTGPVK